MRNIVVLILDGYSASSRKNALYEIFDGILDGHITYGQMEPDKIIVKEFNSRFARSKRRKIKKFLKPYNNSNTILYIIAKSYGVRVAVKIINSMEFNFFRTTILTIDPNWPVWYDFTPNLNDYELCIRNRAFIRGTNIYLLGEERQQCGSKLISIYKSDIMNMPVTGTNHRDIIDIPVVKEMMNSYLLRSYRLAKI